MALLTIPAEETVQSLKQAQQARDEARSIEQLAQEAEDRAIRLFEDAYAAAAAAARKTAAIEEEIEVWSAFVAFSDRCLAELVAAPTSGSSILESLSNKVQLLRAAAFERQAEASKVLEWQKKPVHPALKDLFPAI